MYGLENQKKKKGQEFTFDLEKDLKKMQKYQELKKKIEGRVQAIKEVLRGGGDKEDFDKFGVALHGYVSLLKVISRFTPK